MRITPWMQQLLYPGVREGLAELKRADLRFAVVTGKTQDGADSTVAAAGLNDVIEVVLGYTSVANPKPAPDIALLALDKLGVRPEDTVLVGDSTHDLEMARRAGVQSIAVTYGDRLDARSSRHLQIVGGVADEDGVLRADAELVQRQQRNVRRRLGIRDAGVAEDDLDHVVQSGSRDGGIRAVLRLAGDHREAKVCPFQFRQTLAHARVEELWNPRRDVRAPEHAVDLDRVRGAGRPGSDQLPERDGQG